MLGAWKQQDVGFNNSIGAVIHYGGYLYRFGGSGTSGAQAATDCSVMSAKILEDGSLAQAKVVGNFIVARQSCALLRLNNHVFLVGGNQSGGTNALVTRFQLEPSGGVSRPVECAPLCPVSAFGNFVGVSYLANRFVQMGNKVLIWRPFLAVNRLEVWIANLTENGISNFVQLTECPESANLGTVGTTFYKGNLIVVGGVLAGVLTTSVWALKVDINGSCGKWRRIGELPVATDSTGCVVVDDRLIVMGGRTNITGSVATGKVYSAQLDPDGNLTTKFVEIGALETAILTNRGNPVVSPTHVYLGGGLLTGATVSTNVVQYAKILPRE